MCITTTIAQFELQASWLLNATEDITEAESNIRAAENLNSVKWITGHLTHTRMTILNLVSGKPEDEHYKKMFGKGSSGITDGSFPSLEMIRKNWIRVSGELKPALLYIEQEKLYAPPPFQTSIPDKTLAGLIAYFAIHESFHIGQIAVLRKLTGKPGMAMNHRMMPAAK